MGKMPKNVLQYFKYISQGMSKAEARKKAGLPPKKKGGGRKKWGPGNALYEWQRSHGGRSKRKSKRKRKKKK